jgi:hypothetical protein
MICRQAAGAGADDERIPGEPGNAGRRTASLRPVGPS